MKNLLIVLILSLLISPIWAQANYEDSWKGTRNQGQIGTCHIFAAVALIEAEWANEFKVKADFSEGHLAINHILGKTEESATDRIKAFISVSGKNLPNFFKYFQGGWIASSFNLAKEIGIVEEEDAPYKKVHDFFQSLSWKLSDPLSDRQKEAYFNKLDPYFYKWYSEWQGKHQDWLSKISYKSFNAKIYNKEQLLNLIKEKISCRPIGIEISSAIWGLPGNHAVVLVGHDPVKKHFLVRNSWGRAHLFTRHEKIAEDLILKHMINFGYLQNPNQECL